MRNAEIRSRTDKFAEKLSAQINDTIHIDCEALFYLTRHCNLACPGCYMCANPRISTKTIPGSDVAHWIDAFERVPNFTDSVVFSGGEMFTLDIPYLEFNIQNALNKCGRVQLKTNGAWVQNPSRANDIFSLLRNLDVKRGMVATEEQMQDFFGQFSREYARAHRDEVIARAWRELPTAPGLDLCVSVDDKIHPAASADWFRGILCRVGGDDKIKNNLNLKTFSFIDSKDFFAKRVLRLLLNDITSLDYHENSNVLQYTVRDIPIESYFGRLVDSRQRGGADEDGDITVRGFGDRLRLVFYFYPDQTVSFENARMQPVGRVSYMTSGGGYKTLGQLRKDMMNAMIDKYRSDLMR